MAFFRGDSDPFADPFFSEARHRSSFLNFGDPFESFFGGRGSTGPYRQHALGSGQQNLLIPFGGNMMDPFSRMNEMMKNMHSMAAHNGHGSHSFSQSTVMHVTHDRSSGGQPKVYQASVSSRSGPGGVKETNKMERDSVTGTQKTSVSHQIGDRSRTMNKKYNFKTKEAEQVQEFVNLDEDDAPEFDDEWKQKTQKLNRMLHSTGPPHSTIPSRGLPSSSSEIGLPKVNGGQRSPRYAPYNRRQHRQQHQPEPVLLNHPPHHHHHDHEGPSSSLGVPGHQHQHQQKKKKSSRAVQFNQ